jgi:hypothetical protein
MKSKHTCDTFDDSWVGSDWLLSEKLDLVVQVRNPHSTQKDTTNVAFYCHSPNAQAKETYAKLSNLFDEFRSKQMHPNYNGVHRLVTKL